MNPIKTILEKLEFVRDNQDIFVAQAVEENQEVLSEINRRQLSEGLKSDGSFLPDYSPVSVSVFGKPEGPIKLFDKGNLYDQIGADILDDSFDMFSGDSKADELIDRYDDDQGSIFGIIPENLDIFAREEFSETLINLNEEFLIS